MILLARVMASRRTMEGRVRPVARSSEPRSSRARPSRTRLVMVLTAMPLATSPALYPPMPSASTNKPTSTSEAMVSSLCSRTRPVSVCPTKVSLPLRVMGGPGHLRCSACSSITPMLNAQKETITAAIAPVDFPADAITYQQRRHAAFAISHTSRPSASANQRPRDVMLMPLGLGRTGLLHTRCLTGSGIFQGMNFVTLSGQPRARGT